MRWRCGCEPQSILVNIQQRGVFKPELTLVVSNLKQHEIFAAV